MSNEPTDKRRQLDETFTRMAPLYDENPAFHIAGRRLVEVAAIPAGVDVLDIATGRGAVLFAAHEQVGQSGSVTGIDIAEGMVNETAADVARRGLSNVLVSQMNAESLDFSDSSFDRVLCGFALWFIPDLAGALGEVSRVLRLRGRFAASTWGRQELTPKYQKLAESYGFRRNDVGSHSLNDPEKLGNVLRAAGFRDVEVWEEELTIVHESEDGWWAQRPGAYKLWVSGFDAVTLDRFKQGAFAMMQEFRDSNGIRVSSWVNYAVALGPRV